MCSGGTKMGVPPTRSYREIFFLKFWPWILNSTASISCCVHVFPCFPRNPENKRNLTFIRWRHRIPVDFIVSLSYPKKLTRHFEFSLGEGCRSHPNFFFSPSLFGFCIYFHLPAPVFTSEEVEKFLTNSVFSCRFLVQSAREKIDKQILE